MNSAPQLIRTRCRGGGTMRMWMLLAVAMCVRAETAAAQSSPVQLGVTIGRVSANLLREDIEDAEERTGAHAGAAIVLHRRGSWLGLETGILYVPKGSATTVADVVGTFKLDYIEIPLLLRVAPNVHFRSVQPVALLGASVNIYVRCAIESASGSTRFVFACDDPVLEQEVSPNALDIALTGGLGFDIPVGDRVVWTPAFRYVRGLSDIDEASLGDARNRTWQLSISLRFRL